MRVSAPHKARIAAGPSACGVHVLIAAEHHDRANDIR